MLYKLINKIWYNKNYFIFSYVLLPVSLIWLLLVAIRWLIYKFQPVTLSNKFVICVGNVTVGGGGKTPTVIYLANELQKLNYSVVVLKRIYNSSLKESRLFIKHSLNDATLAGDEACLINHSVDITICKNWRDGLTLLNKYDYDVIIMDDGLQNNSIKKDFNLLVVDSKYNFGNGKVLPAGPLRNLLFFNKSKINATFALGDTKEKVNLNLQKKFSKAKFFDSNYQVSFSNNLNNKKVVAFCGLAIPDKFLTTLKDNNFSVAKFVVYKDHYLYQPEDLTYLALLAKNNSAQLICTEKDIVKIPNHSDYNIAVVKRDINNIELVNFITNSIITSRTTSNRV